MELLDRSVVSDEGGLKTLGVFSVQPPKRPEISGPSSLHKKLCFHSEPGLP